MIESKAGVGRARTAVQILLSVIGLAAGPVIVMALATLLGWVSLQITGQWLEWDRQLYTLVNGWSQPQVTQIIFLLLNDPGIDYVAIIIPTVLFVWFRRREQLPWAAVAVLIALILGSLTIPYTHYFGLRERPFVTIDTAIIDPEWRKIWLLFPTFPSGHLRETVGLGFVLAYFWPAARRPVAFYAAVVAFTRLYLGAHYPSDIAAGAFIGMMDGLVAVFTANRLDWFLRLAAGMKWLRSAYTYLFVPRTPGNWSQDPVPARVGRLAIFLGALVGGAFAGGWAINFQGLRIVHDLMRNFDNSVTQPLVSRFDPLSAEPIYQTLGNGDIIYPVLGVLVLLAAGLRGWREFGRGLVVLLVSVLLVFVIIQLLGISFDRPLPYSKLENELPQEWLLPWASLSAFPQRHVLMVAALTAGLAHFARVLPPLWHLYLLSVGAMLLYFGAAWPTDILVTMLVGQAAAHFAIFLTRNLPLQAARLASEVSQPSQVEETKAAPS